MGRKSRLKQIKRSATPKPSEETIAGSSNLDSTQFVKQLKLEGYKFDAIKRSPELPDPNQSAPQL